jgi:hypothetical protein
LPEAVWKVDRAANFLSTGRSRRSVDDGYAVHFVVEAYKHVEPANSRPLWPSTAAGSAKRARCRPSAGLTAVRPGIPASGVPSRTGGDDRAEPVAQEREAVPGSAQEG